MSIENICREVSRLIHRYDERDPWKLAEAMGIIVDELPMGKTPNSCKGFFLYQSRKKHITINSDLPENIRRIILAHEMGHAVLHHEAARMGAFHDFALYDSSSQMEYEANLFAAEYLLEDEIVRERLSEDTFFFSVAKELSVPPELLDFKFRILKQKGWLVESPIQANSNFLRQPVGTGDGM
ncbi:MAG TPA: ImmA/IrrE family metallo-endopeptidase [Clostridiales bacterium]|jgi:Zn-dependent peptidase ImmA (M78 family)|nr:ImmA/IrrE family metallo-endopeptidase [Clostridiales bacterium]